MSNKVGAQKYIERSSVLAERYGGYEYNLNNMDYYCFKNIFAAENKYLGKRIKYSGRYHSLGRTDYGTGYLVFKTGTEAQKGTLIVCFVNESEKSKLATYVGFTSKTHILIEGVVSTCDSLGDGYAYEISNCIIKDVYQYYAQEVEPKEKSWWDW